MIDVKGLLLNLRRMRRRGGMSAIVGCESFCPFVLMSKSGCYFVGTTLIFVGTAVDYGRTSRASLLVECKHATGFLLNLLILINHTDNFLTQTPQIYAELCRVISFSS